MTTLVAQRTDYDCGIACIAMATGHSYDYVWNGISDAAQAFISQYGMTDGLAVDILKAMGVNNMAVRQLSYPFSPVAAALVTLPSLNFPDRMHFVFWDGAEVIDPQQGRDGRKHYAAHPSVVIRQVMGLKSPYQRFEVLQILADEA